MQHALVGQVAREGDSGVQHSFNIKVRKYSERCEAEVLVFVPIIVEDSTSSPWRLSPSLGGKEEKETVRQLGQRVAVLLVRDNVAMFDSRPPSFLLSVIDGDIDFDAIIFSTLILLSL